VTAIVIGGGIGGLTAVTALQKAGIEAHTYERAPALREIGAGISLWANAIHALDELGLADAIRSRAPSELYAGLRTWRGTVLSAASSNEWTKRLAVSIAVMHRADLLAVLASELSPEQVHLDHECLGFVQDGAGVTARFKNGEVVRGDVLIGADGLHSVIRGQLFGTSPPRYAGYTAWRAVVRIAHLQIVPCESWVAVDASESSRLPMAASTGTPRRTQPKGDVIPRCKRSSTSWDCFGDGTIRLRL
jgi:2-polyprenyl-6-methoxyphenol hydroxylase-like FAD-dependent oxidoreductase